MTTSRERDYFRACPHCREPVGRGIQISEDEWIDTCDSCGVIEGEVILIEEEPLLVDHECRSCGAPVVKQDATFCEQCCTYIPTDDVRTIPLSK